MDEEILELAEEDVAQAPEDGGEMPALEPQELPEEAVPEAIEDVEALEPDAPQLHAHRIPSDLHPELNGVEGNLICHHQIRKGDMAAGWADRGDRRGRISHAIAGARLPSAGGRVGLYR